MSAPLDGITVVALEQAIAAPFATRQLADLGARVIKVERPVTGDFARSYDAKVRGLSSHFVWVNRSKESLTLDLKSPEGKEILGRLLAGADVFIQNLAPGAVSRLGFAPDRLRAIHPELIVCSISGYGSSGPYRDSKAYDLLVQAETGLLSITGDASSVAKAGIPVADIAAAMYAFSGILTALLQRHRSGSGALLEVSLFESLAEWMGYPAYYTGYGGTAPARTGPFHATVMPYGPFRTGDGRQLFLAVQNDREWKAFCSRILEQPEIAVDPRYRTNSDRVDHRTDLVRVIAEAFGRHTFDELAERLQAAKIAYAQLRSVDGFLNHPQLQALGKWGEVASPAGPLWALRPPIRLEGSDPVLAAIPAVGQDTDAILAASGYTAADIAELRRKGVI